MLGETFEEGGHAVCLARPLEKVGTLKALNGYDAQTHLKTLLGKTDPDLAAVSARGGGLSSLLLHL